MECRCEEGSEILFGGTGSVSLDQPLDSVARPGFSSPHSLCLVYSQGIEEAGGSNDVFKYIVTSSIVNRLHSVPLALAVDFHCAACRGAPDREVYSARCLPVNPNLVRATPVGRICQISKTKEADAVAKCVSVRHFDVSTLEASTI